jgi:menaquinone-dependent protoporphyrinogen oxidase
MRVLIAYGSRYGSTKETAARMGELLTAVGHVVDVTDASDVDALRDYDLVFVGSGVYAGFLRRRVVRLLHRIARQHPALPVAVFALGPMVTEAEKPDDWTHVRERLVHLVDKIDGLDVLDTAVFGGVIDPERMNFMFARADARDLRDWREIEAWTTRVAAGVPSHVA